MDGTGADGEEGCCFDVQMVEDGARGCLGGGGAGGGRAAWCEAEAGTGDVLFVYLLLDRMGRKVDGRMTR